MSPRHLFITGGGGYLGGRLARAWLEAGGDQVTLWVHARDRRAVAEAAARAGPGLGPAARYACWVGGDLSAVSPFDGVDPSGIQTIVHGAARTQFNLDRLTAQTVNVDGTRKLLEFASGCPRLGDVTLLSSVYASGLRPGVIPEEALDDRAGFANHYEWSKWAGEQLLLAHFAHLPWRIARLATVIADNDGGQVSQQNAFHNTLKLFYYGLLSVIPGAPEVPLYLVTGTFVTDAVVELITAGPTKTIVHLAHRRDESITIAQLVDIAFPVFGEEPDFTRRRVRKPLYSDAETFRLLAEELRTFTGGLLHQALTSVTPFAPQLFVTKDVITDRLGTGRGRRAPDPQALVERTCRYLVQTRWGREAADAAPQ